MDKNISIKVSEYELKSIQTTAKLHNMNEDDFIKKIIFETIEDDYDIHLADKRYSKQKKLKLKIMMNL